MATENIYVNIWDDYHDDGFVPEGELQETYAYVEGGYLADEDVRAVLERLKEVIEIIKAPGSALVTSIHWHDSAAVHPELIGTEHERFLYKRWQLQLKNLPHREREQIVEELGSRQVLHSGIPVVVYSES